MQEPGTVVPVFRLRLAFDPMFATGRRSMSLAPGFRTSLIALLTAISYYVGSQIGFLLTPPYTPISTFWAPNAIVLAILLLTPPRIWWVLVLAVLPAHLLVQLGAGVPLVTVLGWFAGNIGEALLGAACIRLVNRDKPLFESMDGVMVFVVFGVLLPTFVTSFLDAGGAILSGLGRNFWMVWTARLTSNIVSGLTIVPIIVILGVSGIARLRKISLARYFEAGVLGVAVVAVSLMVFGRENAASGIPALTYAPLVLLIWAALRFGCGGLSVSTLAIAVISLVNAVHGRGPLGMQAPLDAVISLRVLLIAYATPLMFVAALLIERRVDQVTLQTTRSELICTPEQEGRRIAQKLHTDIVGQLTIAQLRVGQFQTESNISVGPILDQLGDEISRICEDVLDLTQEVHPLMVEYLGLVKALKKLCYDTSEKGDMAVSFSAENVPLTFPTEISHRLFRVTRKALENAWQIGSAVPQRSEEATGWSWMREQLLSLDGQLEIRPSPYGGVMLDASVPIDVVGPGRRGSAAL